MAKRGSDMKGATLPADEIEARAERIRFEEGVREGLRDADTGRVSDHRDVAARMAHRFRPSDSSGGLKP
jgi:predicted transcriptional regulator